MLNYWKCSRIWRHKSKRNVS